MSNAERPSYYPNLDVVRLALALEVLYTHVRYASGQEYFLPVQAVPAFVCISGFLIPTSFSSSKSWGHFARKRALRVMPAFLASLVLVAILRSPSVVPGVLLCYITLGQLGSHANLPLWSLGLEEILYALHASTRVWKIPWRLITPAICLVVTCIVWVSLLHASFDELQVCRYAGSAAAFFIGNLMSFFVWKRNWLLAFLPLVAIQAMNQFDAAPYVGHDTWLLLHFALKSAFPVMAALSFPQIPRLKVDLSYGIYVYHFPLMTALYAHGVVGDPLMLWTIIATALVSTASWFAIEKPALNLKNSNPQCSALSA